MRACLTCLSREHNIFCSLTSHIPRPAGAGAEQQGLGLTKRDGRGQQKAPRAEATPATENLPRVLRLRLLDTALARKWLRADAATRTRATKY